MTPLARAAWSSILTLTLMIGCTTEPRDEDDRGGDGMKRLLLALAPAVFATSAACASSAQPPTRTAFPTQIAFEIRNQVSACVGVTIGGQSRVGQVALAEIVTSEVQTLSACGCRSKALAYRVTERIGAGEDEAHLERVFGRVILAPRLTLVIATDVRLASQAPRILEISCALDD